MLGREAMPYGECVLCWRRCLSEVRRRQMWHVLQLHTSAGPHFQPHFTSNVRDAACTPNYHEHSTAILLSTSQALTQ